MGAGGGGGGKAKEDTAMTVEGKDRRMIEKYIIHCFVI